ncbi:MAG TPA: protein kinase [Kofleriaceae bacterium]|jgi:serine/threonine protein kinase
MGDSDPSWSLSHLPEQFGRYSLLGHLATGGMAEVYVARQTGLQGFEKIVVIKCVRADLEGDIEATGFFLDEARLVATLEHPNIAQVYEIGLVNNSYFFVMEYVHGADLRHVMSAALKRNETLPLADAVYIASHACAALHYAHEKRGLDGKPLEIIHRDVSPSNVLISHDGAVKLCDFGIAKAQNRTSETRRGVLKGKYSYMSPEQCRSRPLDRRSDIFSMGIVLYELTTLTRLFNKDGDFELLRAIVDGPVEPPSRRVPDYPAELEQIVMRALEKDPANRYQTAQEMQLDLESFARERKMPQSSVNVAALMGRLFEKKVEAWLRAQTDGKRFEDYLRDTADAQSSDAPAFMPLGSDSTSGVTTSAAKTRSAEIAVKPPLQTQKTSKASPLWLVGAVLAALAGAGSIVAERTLQPDRHPEAVAAISAEADKVASAFDEAANSAHIKSDGIAATPILRAAIATDAATMKDLVTNEYAFSTNTGETIEIFQLRASGPVSLAREPASARPLAPLKAGETRIEIADQHAHAVSGAPIAGTNGKVAGVLGVSVLVDLSAVDRSLAGHATSARVEGFGEPIVLVPPRGNGDSDPITIALPTTDWNTGQARLIAIPLEAAPLSPAWIEPVRYALFGGAGLLLVAYAFARSRARSSTS